MITSFNRDSCANLPGVVCFHFAPANQVCNWPEREGVYINEEPEFATPYEWLSGFAVMDSADFNEEPEENDAGTRYNTSFVGLFPKNSPGVLQLFTEMEKVTHVIRITDKHGQIRLCGSPENPLRFRFTQALGTSPETLNSYRFEFFGSSYAPSPYIISGAVPPITPPFPPCPPIPPAGSFNTVLNGTGAPDNSLGINGDFYIDTASWEIYGPKTAGAWATGTPIEGPPGATGATGPAGPSAVSADAGNAAVLGSDSLIYVPITALGNKKHMTGNATNSTNVYAAITELNIPIAANQIIAFHYKIGLSVTAAGGIRFSILLPTGATGPGGGTAVAQLFANTFSNPANYTTGFFNMDGSDSALSGGTSLQLQYQIWGIVKNGNTPGNITLRFRSDVNGQTNTISPERTFVRYD